MTYSILLLGATTSLGRRIIESFKVQTAAFAKVAVLVPFSEIDGEGHAGLIPPEVMRIVGRTTDSEVYRGIDIVVSAVEDELCFAQAEYLDAAIAGGVKHFVPAEYGADLTIASVWHESYFADKIAVRRHLEARAQAGNLGYTYMMTGLRTDFLLETNLLGLSVDHKSANIIGQPDTRVSITLIDDVAEAIVTSLLPQHLDRLDMKRHIRFSGSTMSLCSVFDALSYVLHHPIDVTFKSPERLDESSTRVTEVDKDKKYASLRRSLGCGAFDLGDLHAVEDHTGIVSNGKGYMDLEPKSWAEVVHEYFMSKKNEK